MQELDADATVPIAELAHSVLTDRARKKSAKHPGEWPGVEWVGSYRYCAQKERGNFWAHAV